MSFLVAKITFCKLGIGKLKKKDNFPLFYIVYFSTILIEALYKSLPNCVYKSFFLDISTLSSLINSKSISFFIDFFINSFGIFFSLEFSFSFI